MYKITKADKIETDKMVKEFKIKQKRLIKLQALMMIFLTKNKSLEDTIKHRNELLEMGYTIEEIQETFDKIIRIWGNNNE